ncbi:MAG: ADYC domain-containing protein [Burkholderiales bacterium]
MTTQRRFAVLLGVALAFASAGPAFADRPTPAAAWRVAGVIGSSIEIVNPVGQRRSGLGLTGVELTLGDDQDGAASAMRLRIVSVASDRVEGVFLHELEALDASGNWQNVCGVDRDGRRLALFIEGHDLPDGRQVHVPGEVSITCSAGVQGKCLRAGYVPWGARPGGGSGEALFQTCTRMYRADYCGDGIGWTRNGMTIDPYDIYGIQRPEDPATLPFEAGWGPAGATCVHHTRVIARGGVAGLLARCPRLAALPSGASCTQAAATAGALMFNRSNDETP